MIVSDRHESTAFGFLKSAPLLIYFDFSKYEACSLQSRSVKYDLVVSDKDFRDELSSHFLVRQFPVKGIHIMTSNQSPKRTFQCDDTGKCVEIQRPATIRRLLDADVRAIFESLHHGAPPPSHLNFQIVPVGPTGLRLSPPAIEFEGSKQNSMIVCL